MRLIAGINMKTVETIDELRSLIKNSPRPIGFVPTMGYLHKGHAQLIKKARLMCKTVVVSIFVNPTQFAPDEDFSSYPRDFEHDRSVCLENGADLIFYPSDKEVYPEDFLTTVKVKKLTEVLEGKSRPTHFEGVTTIVAKLFMMVMPDFAFFGKKDAQQLIVIKKMVSDLNMPVSIVPVEIVREPDGLAYSSRNVYLDKKQREEATLLYKGLMRAKKAFESGEKDCDSLKKLIREEIAKAEGAKIDYISFNRIDNLNELDRIEKGNTLLSLAVFFGKTRLIDNIWL